MVFNSRKSYYDVQSKMDVTKTLGMW